MSPSSWREWSISLSKQKENSYACYSNARSMMMTTGVHLCVCSIGAQGRSFDTDTRFTLNSCVFYTHGRLLFLFVSTSSSPLTDGLLLESCMSVTLTREAMTIGSLVLISYRSMYDAMPSSRENSARARRELSLIDMSVARETKLIAFLLSIRCVYVRSNLYLPSERQEDKASAESIRYVSMLETMDLRRSTGLVIAGCSEVSWQRLMLGASMSS